MKHVSAKEFAPFTHKLSEGKAEFMGDGIFVVLQLDPIARKRQNVVLSKDDLAALRALPGLTVSLEEGVAEYAGSGVWGVFQDDNTTGKPQNVFLTEQDLEALLAAA
ncbi:hypothetical protein NUH86_21730 [Sphingobium sp. JS3065]|uniref:hypothetical protein n=1 Tax=Sphingobium sp. JS3065 TaxID=2970925 RepID=UPI002264F1D4|nr:hypothetical protein [Sphingobium sp. JS3065]UZW57336.1 hypothetical protein NUH86_21730 [Sphingobium sp. JS3065]